MPAITGSDPDAAQHPELTELLTGEVVMLRCRTRRQHFAPSARVLLISPYGAPTAGPLADLLATTGQAPDHALRVDLSVGGLDLAGVTPQPAPDGSPTSDPSPTPDRAALVVVRPGPLEVVEDDRRWSRAFRAACGIVGVECDGVFAVVRSGWLHVDTARAVTVPRLRTPKRRASTEPTAGGT
jgi:hypothetical protein